MSEDNFTVGVDVWWFEKKKEEKTEKKTRGKSLVLGVFAKFPLDCVRFSLFKVSYSSCFSSAIQLSTHLCNTILHVYRDDICI